MLVVSPIPKYWEEYLPLTSSLHKKIFNETIPRTSKIYVFFAFEDYIGLILCVFLFFFFALE